MSFLLQPGHLLLLSVAGWVNRQQQDAIAYLRTENQILRENLGKKRILLNDDQRRRMAVKGKVLGHKLLGEVGTLFTPDTILRWHRQLIASKWDYSNRRNSVGRPKVRQEIVDLVLRFARENPSWGYDRIQGALANLGYHITDSTVGNILKAHGIEPAPDRKRKTTWKTFLKAHWDVIAATDFTTVEVWTKGGLVTFYILFVIVKSVKLPPRSPNLNSYAERFVLSVKQECLARMIFFGETALRNALNEYVAHYHLERNHQGLNNQLIRPDDRADSIEGEVTCRERLGGILKYYYRHAA